MRPAPRAARVDSSSWRALARVSSKLATFAHASSSTRSAAPASMTRVGFTLPRISSRTGCMTALVQCACSAGYDWAKRCSTVRMTVATRAESAATRRRPIVRLSEWTPRLLRAESVFSTTTIGCQNSAHVGNAKPRGITPTTVERDPSNESDLPMMPGSPPKRCCHRSYDRTATRLTPTRSSSGRNVRPRRGGVPNR